jgi:hypothetical protein
LRSYVREMRRVLNPSGVAVISFHDHPANGQLVSGSEHRADYDAHYMLTLLGEEGFVLLEDIGDVCGQHTLALRPACHG